jgi:hypothetical protein
LNRKQRKTLEALFDAPVRSDIRWAEIESLFQALGADVKGTGGSRVRVTLNGIVAVFHRPHPQPTAYKSLVRYVRMYLERAGVCP